MSAATWLPMALSAVISILGGGVFGVWLTHMRLTPKSRAEAKHITAAARDQDWSRFQREIERLVKRVEQAENAAEKAIAAQHACEKREAEINAEMLKLKAVMAARGEIRQRASEIVAADRLVDASRSKGQ